MLTTSLAIAASKIAGAVEYGSEQAVIFLFKIPVRQVSTDDRIQSFEWKLRATAGSASSFKSPYKVLKSGNGVFKLSLVGRTLYRRPTLENPTRQLI